MSDYLAKMEERGFEELVLLHDARTGTGLKGAIAIHSTARGPALGGTRMWTYASEEEAVEDVMCLACGMSYKAAAAELPLGGGKGVIIGDPHRDKCEDLFTCYGRFVEQMNGRFITAADMGITEADLDLVRKETRYMVGGSEIGSPSPFTAYGVWRGMKACAEEVYGSPSLKGKVVAVQGVGSVGGALCGYLAEEGAHLLVSDFDQGRLKQAVKQYGATAVDPGQVIYRDCDIFSPCGAGGGINDETVFHLKCNIVAGAANNVIKGNEYAKALFDRDILYAPDYIINAGGLIFVEMRRQGEKDDQKIRDLVSGIERRLKEIFKRSRDQNLLPGKVADIFAEERLGRR